MWMMGYNDAGDFNSSNIQDPFTGRKLRPLMPRPAASINHHHPPCLTRTIHGADLLTLNHHLVRMGEENKREINTQQVVVSSRWNPTPEQLQNLEELYRRGTRTPSADQIQHITAELRRYGKIEGKNVFYWFQNHKARERQKRRRQQSLSDDEKREAAGPNKTVYEVEQPKNWASPTNSSTLVQKSGGGGEGEAEAGGWVELEDDDAEVQRRRNATWRMMNLSSSSSSSSSSWSSPSVTALKPQDLINLFYSPHPAHAQTLQLFPLRSARLDIDIDNQSAPPPTSSPPAAATPYQFFEFLPLKN